MKKSGPATFFADLNLDATGLNLDAARRPRALHARANVGGLQKTGSCCTERLRRMSRRCCSRQANRNGRVCSESIQWRMCVTVTDAPCLFDPAFNLG